MKLNRKSAYLMSGVLWQYFGFTDQPWGAVYQHQEEYRHGTATASDNMMLFWVKEGYAIEVKVEDL